MIYKIVFIDKTGNITKHSYALHEEYDEAEDLLFAFGYKAIDVTDYKSCRVAILKEEVE